MKKLLSLLTISTLTTSVPVPLLANTVQTRVKRDVGITAKDITTGFDIKIKNIKYLNFNWKFFSKTTGGRELEKKEDKWFFLIDFLHYLLKNC
ncbi:hypothetical protein TS70_06625, partial [Spiroplasma sp. hyd1]|nr:hypothetical protein [Spiroplasma sp. hyd1]